MKMMSGSRISQQLQLGICSSEFCYHYSKGPPSSRRLYPYGLHSKRFLRFELLATNSSSSSSITNDNGDLAGVSFGNYGEDMPETCLRLSPAENGSPRSPELAGGIVALGKFDALHIGHRELAIQAAKMGGVPFLLSFVGIAEVLGWEPRAPIVAKCDRKRVLSSWAPWCGDIVPMEFEVEFSKVRHLTPEQFVQKLAQELGVQGVVAGQNYRFGYKAAGNASDLVRLCEEYGLRACIISSIMDNRDTVSSDSKDQGQVSSTRVRQALANGNMEYVSELLGRHHRLILMVKNISRNRKSLSAPTSCLLNLPPKEGLYNNCSLIIGDRTVGPCSVIIDTTDIHMELDELAPHTQNLELLSIEFGDSKV